jgi:hypothetical protein
LELACQHKVGAIFELIHRTIQSLQLRPYYEKVSLMIAKDGAAYRVHDNSKAVEMYHKRSDGLLREGMINVKGQSGPPEQIKYVEESNPAVQEKMKEMI